MQSTHDLRDYLFPRQRDFFDSSDDRKVFVGGRQSGKTTTLGIEALDAASDGDDVVFLSQQQRMAHDAADHIIDLGFDFNLVHDAKRDQIDVKDGGIIDFEKPTRGSTYHSYDLILVDEATAFTSDTLGTYLGTTTAPVYAAGTPFPDDRMVDWLTDAGFARFTIPTLANPLVNKDFMQEQAASMDRQQYKREFMVGTVLNDHCLYSFKEDDERIYECGLCDFEEKHAMDPDAPTRLAEAWVYGKALDVPCRKSTNTRATS